ncbi:MAG: strawberry notch C-terminal domain-containing protein [Lewinellaceae bacterium]|nr:strawberry notch C-terminal domain-containing protein [Lewinellaceae bacterium]
MIIGDQTGIGKGRIAAAVIRYGAKNGYPTIFITEKATLFSDIYRDLYDIGSVDLVPLIINSDSNATLQISLDSDTIVKVHEWRGDRNYLPKSMGELRDLVSGKDALPPGYDFAMLTYSQLSSDWESQVKMEKKKVTSQPSASNFKTEYIAALANNAVVILDEAHNASGGESTTGYFIRERLLSRAKGCCYLSATFAKRPDNMPVYAKKTAISHANIKPSELEEVFARGGVALQEIVAGELVASGQMLRRQRSFEGIQVEYNYLEDDYERHREVYNTVIGLVNDIIEFEETAIEPFLDAISKAMSSGGEKAEKRKGTEKGGVSNSPFFNKTHNVIRQLLFSIKAEQVAREAIRLLNENKKVVIAFANTMASFMDDFGYTNGDEVENLDFTMVLNRSLENALKYTVISPDGEHSQHILTPQDLDPIGASMLENIREKIREVSAGISLSPIDTLINTIEKIRKPAGVGGGEREFYRVRECTGRSFQIKEEGGALVYRNFKANVKQFFADFNSGDADVLLINQSASTGVSAHASAKFRDQRRRAMIIHQPELDINTEVQKRGRINRTGQVNLPEYLYVSSSIPAEKRILMVLKRKLKSLDANTTGSQKSSDAQLESPDFFNKYGDRVVKGFLSENRAIAAALRLAEDEDESNANTTYAKSDLAETFSRRIALLTVEEQERAYSEVLARYNEYVEDLKQRGEYDLEVEYLPLEAETQEQFLLEEGSGRPTPFGQPAVLEQVSARVLKRPMKWSEVEAAIQKTLQGLTPEEFQEIFRGEYERGRAQVWDAKAAERETKLQKLLSEISELQGLKDSGNAENPEKLEKGLEKAKTMLEELREKIAAEEAKFKAETNNGLRIIDFFTIGRPFQFSINQAGAARELVGVVTNLYFLKPVDDPTRYNPANVRILAAIYGPERSWTFKFNSQEVFAAMGMTTHNQKTWIDDVIYNWNRHDSSANQKEKVFIATGNMLLSAKNVYLKGAGGKLIKYSTNTGAIRSGIQVQKEVDNRGREINTEPKTRLSVRRLADELMLTRPGYNDYRYVEGTAVNNAIAFVRTRDDMFRVTMPRTTAFKPYYGDPELVELLFQDSYDRHRGLPKAFTSYPPNLLAGTIHLDNLPAFLEVLATKYNMTYLGQAQQFNGFMDLSAPIPDAEPSETEQMLTILNQLELETTE